MHLLLIDCRSKGDYEQNHIVQSINIPSRFLSKSLPRRVHGRIASQLRALPL